MISKRIVIPLSSWQFFIIDCKFGNLDTTEVKWNRIELLSLHLNRIAYKGEIDHDAAGEELSAGQVELEVVVDISEAL